MHGACLHHNVLAEHCRAALRMPCVDIHRTQLRVKFKTDGQFYRVFPNGEVRSCFGGKSALLTCSCAPVLWGQAA